MPVKRTLQETYYAINAALIAALAMNYITCDFYKYGIDPVQLADVDNSEGVKYPYFQTFYSNVKENSRTSQDSGIMTLFDYQISYFTAPPDEFADDVSDFLPYEILKNLLTDIQLNVLGDIVTLTGMQEVSNFNFKAGISVPSKVLICKMQAVCAYSIIVPPATESTNIDAAISITDEYGA